MLRTVAKEDVLCSHQAHVATKNTGTGVDYPLTSSTAILSMVDFPFLKEAFPCTNLWHCHASFFMLWTGFQIAINVAEADGLRIPTWIVALWPEAAWAEMGLDSHQVFVPSHGNLINVTMNMRPAVQLLSDMFGGRLILARQLTTIGQLNAILHQSHAPSDIEMWISPPENGLMWELAWDASLSNDLRLCRNSMLLNYRNELLNALSSEDIPHIHIARHVCVVSRQERDRRNMTPEFMLRLLARLGGPLLMTPRTGLRTNTSTINGVPIYLGDSSVSGQLRFVHQECAILLGVHGAGLTNALGLRPGTSVIELQASSSTYQYFRNVAALIDDVDYSVFVIEPVEEVNMYTDDEGLDKLTALVELKLKESIARQENHAKISRRY